MTPIRVMIVDDHDMVRRGLSVFLKSFDDLELIGEAHDGAEALALCGQIEPDVVLMDLMMPEMDGATATRHIREQYPQVRVIALSSFCDDRLVEDVLQAGAVTHMLKNASIGELVSAIRYAGTGAAAAYS